MVPGDAMPSRDEADIDSARLSPLETWSDFPVTPSKEPGADEKRPVLMAKGYSLNHRVRPGGQV